jgi:GDSL-like Lipase/Acylhydrolase family
MKLPALNGDRKNLSFSWGGNVKTRIARTGRVLAVLSTLAVMAWIAMPGVSQAAAKHTNIAIKAKKSNPFKGRYYLALGDSYSVGYQPNAGATTGYTGYVATKLKMTLENFGCGGETTTSILSVDGCVGSTFTNLQDQMVTLGPAAATDAVPYSGTQIAAAQSFIADHIGQIGLITVSIGGNDVTACADPDVADGGITAILACVDTADASITTNVTTLVQDLRSAVGPGVPIVGLTYPDVILGAWVYPTYSSGNSLASDSISAFDELINPTLCAAYTASPQDGQFVNVTAASAFGGSGVTGSLPCPTGSITSLSTLKKLPKSTGVTDVPKHTDVPEAVVDICKTTWYCQLGNIHAMTKGYTDIGKLVVSAVKS